MSGVPKIAIAESVDTLKFLMKQEKIALNSAKIQMLYLFKIKAVETVRYAAVIIGRSEPTIYSWLKLYRQGGLEKLLEIPLRSRILDRSRPKKLNVETVASIQRELSDPKGFNRRSRNQIMAL